MLPPTQNLTRRTIPQASDSAAYQIKAAALVRSRRAELALQIIGQGRRRSR
jgi:hypothetical protein